MNLGGTGRIENRRRAGRRTNGSGPTWPVPAHLASLSRDGPSSRARSMISSNCSGVTEPDSIRRKRYRYAGAERSARSDPVGTRTFSSPGRLDAEVLPREGFERAERSFRTPGSPRRRRIGPKRAPASAREGVLVSVDVGLHCSTMSTIISRTLSSILEPPGLRPVALLVISSRSPQGRDQSVRS